MSLRRFARQCLLLHSKHLLMLIWITWTGATWQAHPCIGAALYFALGLVLALVDRHVEMRLEKARADEFFRCATILLARKRWGLRIDNDASAEEATSLIATELIKAKIAASFPQRTGIA